MKNPVTVPEKLPVANSKRWQLLRAGIQNVWEYDDQRFIFHKGRLLLRGQNESGKTKALEVLLPYLLDASLHAHRLDPFGSNARSMRWNLVNDANAEVNVSIGYVWLELGRLEDGAARYWTIGAGLKARRSANSVEDWYFATSQRVDHELRLLDANRVPLTRPNLSAALGEDGRVFDNADQYRHALNERLFGFGGDQYSALVDALLQLRRPQLSKALDPAELSRILSASLPPLDAGVIGSLAEGFERLDRHRAERVDCESTVGSIRSFLDVYRHYVAAIARARALEVTRADSSFHAARAKFREAETKRAAAAEVMQRLSDDMQQLETESIGLDERLRVLRESAEFRAVAQLDDAERQARARSSAATRAEDSLADSKSRARKASERLALAKAARDDDARTLAQEQELALTAAQSASLVEAHGAVLEALEAEKPTSAHERSEQPSAFAMRRSRRCASSPRAALRLSPDSTQPPHAPLRLRIASTSPSRVSARPSPLSAPPGICCSKASPPGPRTAASSRLMRPPCSSSRPRSCVTPSTRPAGRPGRRSTRPFAPRASPTTPPRTSCMARERSTPRSLISSTSRPRRRPGDLRGRPRAPVRRCICCVTSKMSSMRPRGPVSRRR